MDVGHGSSFYLNVSNIRGAEGQNYFPRFSRQHCGGSNRNGVLFKQYSNSDELLASARTGYVNKPATPRGAGSLQEMGIPSMEDRMARTMEFYSSNPNTFRLKPITKPELPAEARCASPRTKMRSAFNMSESSFVGAIAPTPPKTFRATAAVTGPRNTPGSPGARVVRRVQGPFVYERRNPQLI